MRHYFFLMGICFFLASSAKSLAQGLPIKPTRTISFATDEGTYMDVDVSADGKQLVFGLVGDLFTVSAEGGEARQVTRGLALNVRPVWSPNGKKIACLSDYSGSLHINMMSIDGKLHTVLGDPDKSLDYESDLTWTPDGNFVVAGDSVYGLVGGKETLGVKFQPFLRFFHNGNNLFGIDSGKVCNYNPKTRVKKVIAEVPDLGQFECRNIILSADGRFLAYVINLDKKRALVVSDLVTNQRRVLVPSMIAFPQYNPEINHGVPLPHFCFSPDSKNIYIGYAGKIHKIEVESGSDRIIPFKANVKADLGPLNYNTYPVSYDPAKVRYIRHASTSPDGKHLMFSALDKIYSMDLPNGEPHILVDQQVNQFEPVYSPDGKWVAYASWSDTIGGYLWRTPASGGGVPERLTSVAGYYCHPAWSPDGIRIAVIRSSAKLTDGGQDGTIGRLEVVSLPDKDVQTIEDSVPVLNNPIFSSDGQRLLYTPGNGSRSSSRLRSQVVSYDLLGGDQKVLVIGAGVTRENLKYISPDGRFVVYSRAEDLFLVPVYVGDSFVIASSRFERRPLIRFASGIDPYWEQGGKTLAWTYGNKFYKIAVDKIIDAAERAASSQKTFWSHPDNFVNVQICPDEVAPNLVVSSTHGHGVIALTNVRILKMRKSEIVERGTLVIRDGRILAVGPTGTTKIPSGTKIFNLRGMTIMPGIIDLHLHLVLPQNTFPQQSWMLLVNLAYGVTTARDPSQSYDGFGYVDLLRTGQMIGPRLFTVGNVVDGKPWFQYSFDNEEDARMVLQKRTELGAIVVKNYLSPIPRLQRQWLAKACKDAQLNMTNEGYSFPIWQWTMLKDGCTGVEHNPEWGDVYKDVITLYAKSGTWFTPTLQVTGQGFVSHMTKEYFKYKYWHNPDEKLRRFTISDPMGRPLIMGGESYETIEHAESQDSLYPSLLASSLIDARIRHAGGKVTLGCHGNAQGIGAHNELWALQLGGLTNMEALQAATIMGAEALGVQKDLGSLEVGKIADLIILNKNPLDDIHNSREIGFVMKDGILYDGDTLDEIWPEQKKCPEWKLKTN